MGIETVAGTVFTGLLNHLWTAAVIAGAAWAIARFLPRTNAATRHILWWTVLALVLLLPFVSLQRKMVAGPATDDATEIAPAAPTAAVAHEPSSPTSLAPSPRAFPLRISEGGWLPAVVLLWAAFSFLQACRLAWSFLYLLWIKRKAQGAPVDIDERFRYWVAVCGVERPVRLLVSDRIASPLAAGFRHPAVILPAALPAHFGEGELEHVLLHELAHVARRDDWSNLAARCFGAVAGLHPVAAWTLRQIANERELACDDWVVSRTGEARPYAASLARLFEVCRKQRRIALATGMAGRASQLGSRIETLLAAGRQFSTHTSALRVGLAALTLVMLVAAGVQAPDWIVLAQSSPAAPTASDNPRPVNPHGSFLSALVAAGYGNLSVDEIIALKDHGIDARFLAALSQTGWEKIPAQEMINMHDHGVPPEMLRALRDAGFQRVEMRAVIEAWEQGVRPGTLKEAAQYGTHLSLPQIVKLKQAGVI